MAYQTVDLIWGIVGVVFGFSTILKSKSAAKGVVEFWGRWAADELMCRIMFIAAGVGFIIFGILFFHQYFFG